MNISYNWLKEYVNFDLTPDETAAALTSIGLETGGVEEVQTIKGGLEGLVIGEVLTCTEHPNSDHLHITTVNLGDGEPVQIVCGAPNVAAGQKVVVATLGTKLYDGDECFTIKKSKIRGVESESHNQTPLSIPASAFSSAAASHSICLSFVPTASDTGPDDFCL